MIKIEHTTVTGWEAALIPLSTPCRKKGDVYEAYASDSGKTIYLGTYGTEAEAAKANFDYRKRRFAEAIEKLGLSDVKSAVVFGNYVAFETGKILNLHGKEMVGRVDRCGYREVILAGKARLAHRIIADAFIPKIPGKEYINHKDGNKLNNSVDNLEWVTRSENALHAYRTGLAPKIVGEQHHAHKLSWEIVKEIRDTYIPRDKKFGAAAMARRIGVDRTTIAAVVNNECWREMA